MAEWENMNVLHDGKWPQILFYKRFVDPFLLWDGTVVALEEPWNGEQRYFFEILKWKNSAYEIDFLDAIVSKDDVGWFGYQTIQESCRNTMLHRDSMHPGHIFKNIVKGQTLRTSRFNG